MSRFQQWLISGLIIAALTLSVSAKSLKLNDESIAAVAAQPFVISDSAVNFTVGDIYNRISQSRLLLQGGLYNAVEAKRVIDSIVVDSLTTIEALRTDLRKYPNDYRTYRHQYMDSLVEAVVNLEINNKVAVDSQEVLQFFRDNPEMFQAEEQVLVWQILLSPQGLIARSDSMYNKSHSKDDIARDTRELAWSLWQALNYGESFQNIAFLFSHDVLSQKKNGLVGWTARGKYIDPFDSVAFALKVGEFSRPYEDKDGWHIIQVTGHVAAGVLPIDSPYVYDMARSSLLTLRANQRGSALLDSLYKAMPVTPNPAIMDGDIMTVNDTVWVATIGTRDTLSAWEMKQWESGYRLEYHVSNTSPDLKRNMLDKMARRYIMSRAAADLGITDLPPIARYEQEVRIRTARGVVSRRGEDFLWSPADSTIDRVYREETRTTDTTRPMTVQHVAVKDSMFAIFLKDQANSGVPFEDFVKKEFLNAVNPDAKVKLSGIKKIGQKDVPPEYWRAVFGIDAGKYSGIFRVKNEFYLARVISRIETVNVLGSKGNIRVRLEAEHRKKVWQKFRDELYKTYNVRYAASIESLALKPYRIRNANRASVQ